MTTLSVELTRVRGRDRRRYLADGLATLLVIGAAIYYLTLGTFTMVFAGVGLLLFVAASVGYFILRVGGIEGASFAASTSNSSLALLTNTLNSSLALLATATTNSSSSTLAAWSLLQHLPAPADPAGPGGDRGRPGCLGPSRGAAPGPPGLQQGAAEGPPEFGPGAAPAGREPKILKHRECRFIPPLLHLTYQSNRTTRKWIQEIIYFQEAAPPHK